MNIRNIPMAAAALAVLAVSCVKENDDSSVQPSEKLVPVVFSASGEPSTKTTFSGGKVFWEEADKVTLFSGENLATKTELSIKTLYEDGHKAEFEGFAADGSSSYIAVYPSAEANAYDGSVLTVAIPTEQTAVAGSFMSGANTTVATSASDELLFRNVGALVGINLPSADAAVTTSIKLRAKKSETAFAGITGTSSVTLDPETGEPVAGEGSADYVTITAPEGGFVGGSAVYYAVIYPGTYAGFEVTLTQNGQDKVLADNTSRTLERSGVLTIGRGELPDEFTITVDFRKGWPFKESCATTFTAQGEEYTYSYKYDDAKDPIDVKFVISTRGKGSYSYVAPTSSDSNNGRLVMPTDAATANRYGTISIPPMLNRYPTYVELDLNKATGNRFYLAIGGFPDITANGATQGYKVYSITFPVKNSSGNTVSFPAGTISSSLRDYCMCFRDASTPVYGITIRYSKTKPE